MKGDFFTSRPGFIIFMFIKKVYDALPLILQEFYLFSAMKVAQKKILPAHGLYGFLEGHCHSYYLLLIFTNHDEEKSQA